MNKSKIFESLEAVNKEDLSGNRVYVIETKEGCKIGRSANVKRRLQTLSSTLPLDFSRIYIGEQCENFCEIENSLHKRLSNKRMKGEWFDVSFDVAIHLESSSHHNKPEPKQPIDYSKITFGIVPSIEETTKRYWPELYELLDALGFSITSINDEPYILIDGNEVQLPFFLAMVDAGFVTGDISKKFPQIQGDAPCN